VFSYRLDDHNRLTLLRRSQAPDLLALVERDRAHLGEFLHWAADMSTVDAAAAFLGRAVTSFAEDELPGVGIWRDGRLVGGAMFFPLDRATRATEVGYWLESDACGHGLMGRTLHVVLDHVFDDLAVHRVGLQAAVANTRSRRLAERLGFQFEGVRRAASRVGDRIDDTAIYALLAGDPRPWHGTQSAR
jgi:ribosomal-protein-serine acetyltransferase